MDKIILGTAGLGGVWGDVNIEESVGTIWNALSYGIPALDTAPAYGDAEEILGIALAQWTGVHPRLSTKVGRLKSYRADSAHYDYSSYGMACSVENSLKILGVSQLEVLFLHDPAAILPQELERVVNQMLFFKDSGYTKKIGLGGNTPAWFAPYLENEVFDVVMEYNRLNACSIEALDTSLKICNEAHKEYYAASPLNMGLLGCNYNSFCRNKPDWLGIKATQQAERIHEIAQHWGLDLDALALRFLFNIPASFHVVLGASDSIELDSSIQAIKKGKLPDQVYQEVLKTLH